MKLVLDSKELLEASDYRGFLATLYKMNKKENLQFSYAYIAKRCHFSSKSFVKEVIDGKKNLSLESTHKIVNGLSFPSLWSKYFLSLVRQDAPGMHKELSRLRSKLINRKPISTEDNASKLFQFPQWPYIYAALGLPEKGATLIDILNRTGLNKSIVESILELLIAQNLVTQQDRRFVANQDTVFFENLGKSQFFKIYYTQAVGHLFDQARKNFESESALFYTMSLSVNPKNMPQFRKELTELLDKYTSEAEEAEGSRVASLTCGFHLI